VSDAYRKIVREARDHWGVGAARDVDWSSIDQGLFDRIERDRRERRARFTGGFSAPLRFALAGSLSVAIVLAIAVGKMHEAPPTLARGPEGVVAGVIVGADGRALVNGAMLGRGTHLHAGDTIDARARVTVECEGHASFALEEGTLATITRAEAPLVLALVRGAIEAEVVPVPSGEAFAVDVDGVRVAVHGTHLRVARSGPNAVVDLNEGVVSVGAVPRVGTVLGTLIEAPAHAEFLATDAQGTLTVTHDAGRVRTPVTLASMASSEEAPHVGRALPVLVPAAAAPAKGDPNPVARAIGGAPSVRAEAHPVAAAPSPASGAPPLTSDAPLSSEAAASASGPPVSASDAPPASDEQTKAALAAAVRACMGERPAAENVTVVVETTLYLGLQDDGTVRSARFEPPVAPDVNACATPAIYRARFAHGGAANVVLSYVSK
jgi:hypothetical protein